MIVMHYDDWIAITRGEKSFTSIDLRSLESGEQPRGWHYTAARVPQIAAGETVLVLKDGRRLRYDWLKPLVPLARALRLENGAYKTVKAAPRPGTCYRVDEREPIDFAMRPRSGENRTAEALKRVFMA